MHEGECMDQNQEDRMKKRFTRYETQSNSREASSTLSTSTVRLRNSCRHDSLKKGRDTNGQFPQADSATVLKLAEDLHNPDSSIILRTLTDLRNYIANSFLLFNSHSPLPTLLSSS